jgi:hypothetical protein
MSQSHDLVRSPYASFAAGDVPGFLAKLHPNLVWNEAEGFPLADRNPYTLATLAEGVFARVLAEWPDFKVVVGELAGGPEVVTMFGRYRGTHAKTKKPLDVQVAHTWWLRDGKVARFQQMVDTTAVARSRT